MVTHGEHRDVLREQPGKHEEGDILHAAIPSDLVDLIPPRDVCEVDEMSQKTSKHCTVGKRTVAEQACESDGPSRPADSIKRRLDGLEWWRFGPITYVDHVPDEDCTDG